MPVVSNRLMSSLQTAPPLPEKTLLSLNAESESTPRAIVVLGGGRRTKAPEFNYTDTANDFTLERLRYAALLHKKTKLPVLVSGGSVFGQSTPEAVIMNQILSDEFSVFPKWLEPNSQNTFENAENTASLLKEYQIDHILLVTHAWHMPRAEWSFSSQGMIVTPAPTSFIKKQNEASNSLHFIPSARALMKSQLALHEMLGYLWYQLRY